MSKRPYSAALIEASQDFLKAARSGNLDRIVSCLQTEDVDINATNANGLSGLHLASKEGHALIVVELLKRGAYIEQTTKKGYTALHIASLAGQEEIVRILVENGSKINAQSQSGFTPLYMSAQENHPNVVSCLLENNADPTIATEDGYSPLAVSLQLGHEEVVELLMEFDTARGATGTLARSSTASRLPPLHAAAKKDDVPGALLLLRNARNTDINIKAGCNLVNDITKSGFTPLHIAAHYGNIRVGQILIDAGADVDFKARNSITPLHVASKWGRANMVQLLLDNGARLDCATKDELTPLHCSARSGHDQALTMLVERGAPINAKTKNGLAPLHMSAQGDHVETSRILLLQGAPIEDVTIDYLTPLHVTAHCGNVKTCKLLLDGKCEVDARALNGFTPLHVACKKNRIPVIELLLKYKATLEATTETGMTPLHIASFLGHKEIVDVLLKEGADPNKKTTRGETSLHLATRGDQNGIMETLLNNGAEVDAKANELQTSLHIAARQGHIENVKLLLDHGASPNAATKDLYTPLHIAAREGHLDVAKVLLDAGANQNLTTKKGFAPLHIAAKHGHLPMTKLLLERGGDVDVKGRNELTPLHVATHYGHGEVAQHLLDNEADPVCQAKNGYTPLHIAAKKNLVPIAKSLLHRGAKPNAESKNGFTPLHLASKEGHVPMVSLLLQERANPECRAKNGLSPMHLAAQEDHVPVAEVLVKYNASIDPQTKAGYTPLHTACHFGQINMIEFLLRYGAKVNAQTKSGYTPLHQAAQQGHVMVINLLLKYKADPNALTASGHTPLSIAEQLGYLSVVEVLDRITDAVVSTTARGRFKPVAPETMQEASMMDGDRNSKARLSKITADGSDTDPSDSAQWPWSGNTLPLNTSGNKSFRDDGDLFGDRSFDAERYSGATPSMERKALENELRYMREPLMSQDDFIDKTGSTNTMTIPFAEERFKKAKLSPDLLPVGCDLCQLESVPRGQSTPTFNPEGRTVPNSGLLVSFIADSKGGSSRGCPHSGVHVIVPPQAAVQPVHITCRLVKVETLSHPPQLLAGEALASRIIEMGPIGEKFAKPVLIEVPHFASLRGHERETTILLSDDARTWREHIFKAKEDDVVNVLKAMCDDPQTDEFQKRVTRIVTTEFPKYFAIISRIFEDLTPITPSGGAISSTSVPGIKASFPSGALTKNTKLGLQVTPVSKDLVKKRCGNKVSFSPIVTLEPVRRRFHKPVRVSIPSPVKSALKKRDGEAQTLRLLCSVTEENPIEMEDITDSTPMTIANDMVSFNTPLSARFWLVDCPNIDDSARMASELYPEATRVPFMAKFVVFAKRHHPMAARIRVYCVVDDNVDRLFKNQGKFVEIGRSGDVEVMEGAPQYLEWAGNLSPVSRSHKQLSVVFHAFKENRASFIVRIRDPAAEPRGHLFCMRDPKLAKGEEQTPICTFDACLPLVVYRERSTELEDDEDGADIDLDRMVGDSDDQNGFHNRNEVPLDELCVAQEALPTYAAAPRAAPRAVGRNDSRQETPYDDAQLRLDPASMNDIEFHQPDTFAPRADQKEMVRKPQITHKTVDGEIQSRTTIEEDIQNLPDGRSIKRKVITTKHVKPVTELTLKDDVIIDSKPSEVHVGTDIEENILDLPAGVIEPNAANCDTSITIDNSDVPLPDGIIAKKKVVKMIISLKDSPDGAYQTVEGDVISKETIEENEEKLSDGRTIRRKIITTTCVKPITELATIGGRVTETRKRDEVISVSIEENVLELPVGMIEPNSTNCDTEITVENSEEPLPDVGNVIARRCTTKMTVRLLGDENDQIPGGVKGEGEPLSSQNSRPLNDTKSPTDSLRPLDTKGNERGNDETGRKPFDSKGGSERGTAPGGKPFDGKRGNERGTVPDRKRGDGKGNGQGVAPEKPGQSKRGNEPIQPKKYCPLAEGCSEVREEDIEYRTETKDARRTRDDGVTISSKTITRKHIQPISRVTRINGKEHKSLLREDIIGGDIVENVLILPRGIVEPIGDNRTSESSVKYSDDVWPGGVIAKLKVVTTVVRLLTPEERAKVGSGKPPSVTRATVEGPVEAKPPTEVEDTDNWPDGTAIRRKEITTKHIVPVTEIVIGNGKAPESSESEKLVAVDIAENILQMPCGVVEPHAVNCRTDIDVKKSKVKLPDGTEANKKVVRMQAHLKHAPCIHKCPDGEPFSKQEIVENKQILPDNRISRQKVVTTKHFQPITEVTIKDGKVVDNRSKDDLVGVDIDENILELPIGVIEPHAANCVMDISVVPSIKELPNGIKAKKTTVKMTVQLKDNKSPPGGVPVEEAPIKISPTGSYYSKPPTPLSVKEGSPGGKLLRNVRDGLGLPEGGIEIVEGDIEYRTDSKANTARDRNGGTVKTKLDTTKHIKPIYQVKRVRGVNEKTLLREDVVGGDIVNNILELPPGVNEPNGENLKSESTVKKEEETLPNGIVVNKKIVRTVVSVIPPTSSKGPGTKTFPVVKAVGGSVPTKETITPTLTRRTLESDPETIATAVDSVEKLPDGTAIVKKEVTLQNFIPVTEVILANGSPPNSESWEKPIGTDVVETNLRLPTGTIEPNGTNCTTDISVDQKPFTLPDGTPANAKIITVDVDLDPPASDDGARKRHDVTEGDIKAKEEVSEDVTPLADGSTQKRKIITTKYIKPFTDITMTDGVVTDSSHWEEIVDANIDEHVLILPVGVVEPNASNVDVEITVENSEVELPEGINAKKTAVRVTATLKEDRGLPAKNGVQPRLSTDHPGKHDEEANKALLAKLPKATTASQIPEASSRIVEGPMEKRTSVSRDEKNPENGSKLRIKTETTRNVRPIFKVGKINGVEHKALLREEVVDADVIENILEIPRGAPSQLDSNTAMKTTVENSDERLFDGTPARKKVIRTVVQLPVEEEASIRSPTSRPGRPPSAQLPKSIGQIIHPGVNVIEGEVKPVKTVTEDQWTLDDGVLVKQKEITTKMVKTVTEVTYTPGQEPESKTIEVVVGAEVKEIILQLPPGVYEPAADNCLADINITNSVVMLPDGTPAKKKLIEMIIALKDPTVTHSIIEGDIVSKTETTEDEKNLRDGSTLRRKVITTTQSRPVTDVTMTNGVFTSEQTVKKLVGIDIEENLIRLPVGVIEPHASNCEADISVDTSEFPLPDGSAGGRKKVVKMLVRLKGQSAKDAAEVFEDAVRAFEIPGNPSAVPPSPSRIMEGAIVFRTETDQDEKKLEDGTTVKSKRVTTRHVKPTIKVVMEKGVEKKTLLREEIVGADIEESLLELPPGIREPGKHKLDTTVRNLQERLPDGTLAKKRVVRSVVLLPGQSPQKAKSDSANSVSPKDKSKEDAKLASTGSKIIEGDVEPRQTVDEDCKNLDQGRTQKRKTVTTRFFKPITEITFVEGTPTQTKRREEIVRTEIDENILELPAGVLEPFAKNCDTIITVDNVEEVMPDGLPAQKRVVKMVLVLKEPERGTRLVEGEIVPKIDVKEDVKVHDDGSTSRVKIITTKFMKPVTEITLVNGKETTSKDRVELVGVEIEEVTLNLPAGVIEPFGHNLDTKTSVDQFDFPLPDGMIAKKKVVKIDVHLKTPTAPVVSHEQTEGAITSRKDEVNDETTEPDGTVIRRRIVTIRYFKPITEVTVVDGKETETKVKEEPAGVEVEENVLKLCPGVTSPEASNVTRETREKKIQEVLPDGSLAQKTIIKTTVRLKEEPKHEPRIEKIKREGDRISRDDMVNNESQEPDGTVVRRRIVTTRHFKPITEVTLVDGVETESHVTEEPAGVEVEETILKLCPGVTDPEASNVTRETKEKKMEEVLPDGSMAQKRLIKTTVRVKEKPKHEPKIDHKKIVGAMISRDDVVNDESSEPDGTVVRRRIITTRHFKPTTEVTIVDGVETESRVTEEPAGVEVEETILKLCPGVTDPEASNVTRETKENKIKEVLPDGSMAQKRIIKTVVRLKEEPKREPKIEIKKIVGAIISRDDIVQDETSEPGGTLVRRRTLTTRHFKPTTEVTFVDGVETDSRVTEEPAGVEVEETILKLCLGVTDPEASNVTRETKENKIREVLPDGSMAQKRIIKTVVRLKVEPKKVEIKKIEGPIISRDDVVNDETTEPDGTVVRRRIITTRHFKQITEITVVDGVETESHVKEEPAGVEVEETVLKLCKGVTNPEASNVTRETKENKIREVLPDGSVAQKRIIKTVVRLKESRTEIKKIEGAMTSRHEEVFNESVDPDGTVTRTRTITTRHFRMITEVTVVDDIETESHVKEEPTGVEVTENITKLCPGVTDPDASNVTREVKENRVQGYLPDGSLAQKKITRTIVRLKEEPKPKVEIKKIEGALSSHQDEENDESTRPDGTVVKRHTVTTRHFKPITEVTYVNGKEAESRVKEEPKGIDVVQTILKLLPGVTDPNASNVSKETREKKLEERLPDGSLSKKRIIKTIVRVKEEPKIEMTRVEPVHASVVRPDLTLTTIMKPTIRKTVRTKIRRIGPDGNITEDVFTEEEDLNSEPSSPTAPSSPFLLSNNPDNDPNNLLGIKVYTDTQETEPVIDRQVQEFEETLPDGTHVRRRLIKKTERRTITRRIIMEGPEQELAANADAHAQQFLQRGVTPDRMGHPRVTRYTDTSHFEPDTKTDLEEFEEVLSDGSIAKTRVKTTTQAHLTTERQLMTGTLQDAPFRELFEEAVGFQINSQPAGELPSSVNGTSGSDEQSTRLRTF